MEINAKDGREVRAFDMELRAGETEGGEPLIEGEAVVYNQKSEVMWDFREVIEPGFFSNVMDDDVRALWNHDDNLPLGRTRNKTLELQDSDHGLNVRIHPPDTQAGRDALVSIKRGDVNQMSFAFAVSPTGSEWRKEKDGTLLRVLKRGGCERLFDVSPVTYPAYPQTSVQVRAMVTDLLTANGQASQAEEQEAQRQVSKRHSLRKKRLQLEKRK